MEVPVLQRQPRFNEAPAKRGGKSDAAARVAARRDRFNEAPAKRGGKLNASCS